MRKILGFAAFALASVAMSAPASAALSLGSTGSIIATGTGGGSVTVNLDGYGGATPTVIGGLTSAITLNFISAVNGTYTFGYSVANTSSAPITGSRVSGFAFDTNPNIVSASVNGFFNNASSGNYPNHGNVEVCFNSANSCAGGGNEGVTMGSAPGTGQFTLNFGTANPTNGVTITNFVDRYQSLAGAGGTQSAIGRVVAPVPEPATWAMMLVGFGAMGVSMRRRRGTQHGAIAQIA